MASVPPRRTPRVTILAREKPILLGDLRMRQKFTASAEWRERIAKPWQQLLQA
jgi:hypothetical protein